jgi:hypothetical protein
VTVARVDVIDESLGAREPILAGAQASKSS